MTKKSNKTSQYNHWVFVLGHLVIRILNLFRISIFEFRIYMAVS